MKKCLSVVFIGALLSACATSPTGRSQMLLFPEGELSQMGVAAFADKKKSSKVVSEAKTNQYVLCVANAITAALTGDQQRDWEVAVFEDDSANAFALPGAKIGVHTGMLKVAVNQDQLAAVIGHEVGHVLANHGNERMSIEFASQTGQQLLGTVLQGSQQGAMVMAALGLGTQYGIALPYSRAHEAEADLIGLDLMAKAGFDPRGSVTLWRNMAKISTDSPPEILSTHPAHETRINGLDANMEGAYATYKAAQQQGRSPKCQL
jgi:predicted Zn-dependent protease